MSEQIPSDALPEEVTGQKTTVTSTAKPNTPVTRRSFLRLAALFGGTAALGGALPRDAQARPAEPEKPFLIAPEPNGETEHTFYVSTQKTVDNADGSVKMVDVQPEQDTSTSEIIKTSQGTALVVKLDTKHLDGQQFERLKIGYRLNGDEFTSSLSAETLAAIAAEQHKLHPKDNRVSLIFTDDPSEEYANVIRVNKPISDPPIATSWITFEGASPVRRFSNNATQANAEDRVSYSVTCFDNAGK